MSDYVKVNKIELATDLTSMLIVDTMEQMPDNEFKKIFPNGIFTPLNLDEPEEDQMREYTKEGQEFLIEV